MPKQPARPLGPTLWRLGIALFTILMGLVLWEDVKRLNAKLEKSRTSVEETNTFQH